MIFQIPADSHATFASSATPHGCQHRQAAAAFMPPLTSRHAFPISPLPMSGAGRLPGKRRALLFSRRPFSRRLIDAAIIGRAVITRHIVLLHTLIFRRLHATDNYTVFITDCRILPRCSVKQRRFAREAVKTPPAARRSSHLMPSPCEFARRDASDAATPPVRFSPKVSHTSASTGSPVTDAVFATPQPRRSVSRRRRFCCSSPFRPIFF